jgi:hypothetical protein
MGKPIDKNKPTKNLDELLGHLNPDSNREGDDLDAFEQEALEGFATLESSQEAVEMKQRLDKRMEEKLAEKRKPLFIYWSAAAGVALIIGLIFMMNSNKDLNSESGLADNSAVSEKVLESGENNPAAPPAELKKEELGKKMSGAMGGKGDSQSQGSGNNDFKQQGPAQKAAEDLDSRTNESPVALAETSEGEKDADKKTEDYKRADNSKQDDAFAKNKNQDQSVPGYNNAAGSAASAKDANNEKSVSAATKSPAKETRDEEQAEPKATEYFTARKLKKDKEKNKSSAQADTKPASEIEGKFESSNIKTASLSIKETELKAKIDKFFSDKDYKKSFVCTLTINADDKVEGLVFQNPELFHKGEQKEIVDFFKKLKCFKNHEFAVYSTYVVKYQSQ